MKLQIEAVQILVHSICPKCNYRDDSDETDSYDIDTAKANFLDEGHECPRCNSED